MKKSFLFVFLFFVSAALAIFVFHEVDKKNTHETSATSQPIQKRSVASDPSVDPASCANESGQDIIVLFNGRNHTLNDITFEPPVSPSSAANVRIRGTAIPEGSHGGFVIQTEDGDCKEDDYWGWSCQLTADSRLRLNYDNADKTCIIGEFETTTPAERQNNCFSCLSQCPHATRDMKQCDYGCPADCTDAQREEYRRSNQN